MNASPALSIITPAYNRGRLLKRCYDSLQAQTCRDFEWIIVDDGSTDDTEAVVAAFPASDFPIVYVKKENGGKHTALNESHPYIHGDYVLILDSDDLLTPEAVGFVLMNWSLYRKQKDIGLVTFLKGTAADSPVCTVNDYGIPVDILRYCRNPGIGLDCCEVIRTDLFKKYPFPVFPKERFIAECALWNRVALEHSCVYVNKVIYICEYLPGGLTDGGRNLRISNPRGGMFTSHLRMSKKNIFSQRIKYGLLYCCYGFFACFTPKEILAETHYKLLTAACLLPGYGIYLYWNKRYGD